MIAVKEWTRRPQRASHVNQLSDVVTHFNVMMIFMLTLLVHNLVCLLAAVGKSCFDSVCCLTNDNHTA